MLVSFCVSVCVYLFVRSFVLHYNFLKCGLIVTNLIWGWPGMKSAEISLKLVQVLTPKNTFMSQHTF